MVIDAVCRNKNTALLILETIIETMKSDTQRAALKAVASWIGESNFSDDISKMSPEERRELMLEIETGFRDLMSIEQRKPKPRFTLKG